MRVSRPVCLLVAFGLTCSFAPAAPRPGMPLRPIQTTKSTLAVPGPQPQLVADEVVVKLTAETAAKALELPEHGLPQGLTELQAVLTRHGIQDGYRVRRTRGKPIRDEALFRSLGLDRLYVLQLPQADEAKALGLVEELSGKPWVEYAEPVYLHVLLATPNDPLFNQQWAHENVGQFPGNGTVDADMDSTAAWDVNTGTPSAAVAILDTGIQMSGMSFSHPDLSANVDAAEAWDHVGDDPFPEDTQGHGTSVAGIAAATGNNGLGVSGLCQRCRIFPKKVQSSTHDANAIMESADAGAASTNMSHTFGCNWLQAIKDAADYAMGLGTINVASAANFNGYTCSIPAAFPGVISAGGTNANDQRVYTYADYSEISAPGVNTRSTSLVSSYNFFGGTSASSPFIAGLAGLLKSERPDLTGWQLRHTMRLGAEDEVSNPDPPGWDVQMGWGRINADNSMNLLNAKWIALDRGHYVCESDVTIAVQDATAGATLDVSITGYTSGDVETVTLDKVVGSTDYYEGTVSLNWVDVFGSGTAGDGLLDVTHDETITATDGPRTAEAFLDCMKEVCRTPMHMDIAQDCDQDGSADPGETRTLTSTLVNLQTEIMEDAGVFVSTTSPWIDVIDPGVTYGNLFPFGVVGSGDGPRIRIRAGAPAGTVATLDVQVMGKGWNADVTECGDSGYSNGDGLTLVLNRDKGTPSGIAYGFDSGTHGFTSVVAHGTGDLPECSATYSDPWNPMPAATHVESGRAMGTSFPYANFSDGALMSAAFNVPAGGGVLGWYQWLDAERQEIGGANVYYTDDGLILEAKRTADTTWTYLDDASYDHTLWNRSCSESFPFGATASPRMKLFAGDGDLNEIEGDEHDREQLANLSDFAGEEIQVRWRFGSGNAGQEEGAWIDTVTVYNAYGADTWPGAAPQGMAGSDASCAAMFDVTADPISGAADYTWYRSEVSCQDAQQSTSSVSTTAGPSYSDPVVADVEYFYAVAANESGGTTCATERACIAGGCCTSPPGDPSIDSMAKSGGDVVFTLGYLGVLADVYRDAGADRTLWGLPHAPQVSDGSSADAGFQYTDVGGLGAGTIQHYIFSGSRCGVIQPPI